MFAEDTVERFLAMCTFSDGSVPRAIGAIREAGFKINKFCTFNNSAIFENADETNVRNFFTLCFKSFTDFEKFIRDKRGQSVSLKNTQNNDFRAPEIA